jgi:hypothetical protein
MEKQLTPLIDGDILVYELASCGEYKDEDGELNIRNFEFVQELVDGRIRGIMEDIGTSSLPIIFLTGNSTSTRILNRTARVEDRPDTTLLKPFREVVATIKPYKGTRKVDKPFHYENVTAHLLANYDCRVSNGIEADDLMAVEQTRRPDETIICSRDKDLRMVPGWHFGWECGKQPSFGPELVDRRGKLWLNKLGEPKGTGLMFFFYQMLVGDTVDNISGCPKVGPKKAFAILSQCSTKKEAECAVRASYEAVYGDEWETYLQENSKLLWMARELNEDGTPVYYEWTF